MSAPRPKVLVIYRGEVATFALHLLAYAQAFPDADYSFLAYGAGEPAGKVIRELCERLAVTLVDEASAKAHAYDIVMTHSYVDRANTAALVASITHRELWFYADMIRNGFIFPDGQDLSRSTLVYFGWILNDESWASGGVSRPREVRVVPLDSIKSMWRLVAERVQSHLAAAPQIDENTLLIALRYWGNTSIYQTRQPDSLLDPITALDLPNTVTNVVVKHDPRSLLSAQDVIESLQARFGPDIRVSAWQDKSEVREALGALDVLDLYLFNGDWLRGHFFGFDGTPNVLVAATQPHATIHWPNVGRLGAYFFEPHAIGVVREGIAWQKEIVDHLSRAATETLSASYDGSHFRALFESRLEYDSALASGYMRTIVDHMAATAGMAANPDLRDLLIRLDGLKRDRLYFDRLSQSQSRAMPRRVAEAVAGALGDATPRLTDARVRPGGPETELREFALEHKRILAAAAWLLGIRKWKVLAPVRAVASRGRARTSQPETLPLPTAVVHEPQDT